MANVVIVAGGWHGGCEITPFARKLRELGHEVVSAAMLDRRSRPKWIVTAFGVTQGRRASMWRISSPDISHSLSARGWRRRFAGA